MREAAQYLRVAYLLTSGLDSEARVLEVVLALHYTGDALYKKPDVSKLASEYDRATKRIELTCAGLISCHGHEGDIAGDSLDLSSRTALDCWRHCGRAKFTWCHRTARDFFDPDQPGANFVDIHTQYQSSWLVEAAIGLAELVFECLVAMEPQSPKHPDYDRKELLLSRVCSEIEFAEFTDSNIKQTAIEIVHHVDKCINHRCDWCGRTGDNFWQSVWTEKHGTATDDSTRPTDFFTFASSSEVYFHLEDRLDRVGQSLSHSEIQRLAYCVAWTNSTLRWTIKSLRQLKLVTRLVQLGADANSSDLDTTIWEEALRYIYESRYDSTNVENPEILTISNRGIPTELASIVEIFLQNGAHPYPVVHMAQFEGSRWFIFGIDLVVSELPTYRRILERLITAGEVSQTIDTASRSFSPRIYIRDNWTVDPSKPDEFNLNDEIRPPIHALIDQVHNTQGKLSPDFRDQIIRQIRAILPTKG